jgi:hypothetical protein
MQVTTLHENTDGSTCVMFDMTQEEHIALLSYGILEALKAGIREGEKLQCEGEDLESKSGMGNP